MIPPKYIKVKSKIANNLVSEKWQNLTGFFKKVKETAGNY